VNRRTALWCITVFFGASIAFQGIKLATDSSPQGVTLGLEVGALVLMILAVVLIVRRRR